MRNTCGYQIPLGARRKWRTHKVFIVYSGRLLHVLVYGMLTRVIQIRVHILNVNLFLLLTLNKNVYTCWEVFLCHLHLFHKQSFNKQLALRWQSAKQHSGQTKEK